VGVCGRAFGLVSKSNAMVVDVKAVVNTEVQMLKTWRVEVCYGVSSVTRVLVAMEESASYLEARPRLARRQERAHLKHCSRDGFRH